MMRDYHREQAGLNRREFLIGLGAVSLMIVSGCATFRRGSELDAAFADLDAQLNRASGADASIDAYIEESSNRYTAAPELIERLEPLDRKRTQTLQAVIDRRQSLFELLGDEQWEAVFN